MNCHIEIYLDGRWQIAATFEPYPTTLDEGTEGASTTLTRNLFQD